MGRLLALLMAAVLGPQPSNPAIPLIDLASERSRQVVVDREEGQYLGHVTTVQLVP
jgi:hypothetical protein